MAWTDKTISEPGAASTRHSMVVATVLLAASLLQACSVAGPKRSPLPQDGPNLVDVYREHIRTEGVGSSANRPGAAPAQAPGYPAQPGLQTVSSPATQSDAALTPMALGRAVVDQRFRRLPNPDLVLFVYPHLARGKHPVPGYYTVLPMYTQVEYAMPGEAPAPTPRAAAPRGPSPALSTTNAKADAAPSSPSASSIKPAISDVVFTTTQQP
jgi:conjugative transfer region lipoprotein (TIGR03751 family)